jgi:hypothetical protein
MNELYEKTIEVDGVVYNYDPDQDIYYRRYQASGHWDQFGWIYITAVLAVICYCVEYRPFSF